MRPRLWYLAAKIVFDKKNVTMAAPEWGISSPWAVHGRTKTKGPTGGRSSALDDQTDNRHRREELFMAEGVKRNGTLVTGVIGNDVHIAGIRIVEYALRKAGYQVFSLGAMTTAQDFIDAALETKADAILVSSMNGHAKICCDGLRDKCIESGLKDIILYLGGMLVVGQDRFEMSWEAVERTFLDMGFNRVYPPGVLPDVVIADLQKDLKG